MTAKADATWRLLDTGLRPAAQNIALNRALLQAHSEGASPHTLRFLRFTPCALLGFHQVAEQELYLDYCHAHDIGVQRRLTGGGAICFDPGQLGWELYTDRRLLGTLDLGRISEQVCNMAAAGLRGLGVDAHFRPRNDIEVDGRKLSGTGGVMRGNSLLFQGTLLLDLDPEMMLGCLRVPAEKLTDKATGGLLRRMTSLHELLGRLPLVEEVRRHLSTAFAAGLGVDLIPADSLTDLEQTAYQAALCEIDSDEWVYGVEGPPRGNGVLQGLYRVPGGTVRSGIRLDSNGQRIAQIWLSGDFFLDPPRLLPDLEAALRNARVSEVTPLVEGFFAARPGLSSSLRPGDFARAIHATLEQGRP